MATTSAVGNTVPRNFATLQTAVPCSFLSDTVCVHEEDLGQWLAERRGYFYAHPDYHGQEGEGDTAQVVYSPDTDTRQPGPEVFGRAQYHQQRASHRSLTSQIVQRRLNETGELGARQKAASLEAPASDYGKPTFYSGSAAGPGHSAEDNEAASFGSAAARPVAEVAKVLLGSGHAEAGSWGAGARHTRLRSIQQLLGPRGGGGATGTGEEASSATSEATTSWPAAHTQPRLEGGGGGEAGGGYRYGVEQYEAETSEVTQPSPGDQAIREIVHLIEEDRRWVVMVTCIPSRVTCHALGRGPRPAACAIW